MKTYNRDAINNTVIAYGYATNDQFNSKTLS